MRKHLLIIMVVALTALNLAGSMIQSSRADESGNMGCQSLPGCNGSAKCDSPGSSSGCSIACTNGAQILCPKGSGGGDPD